MYKSYFSGYKNVDIKVCEIFNVFDILENIIRIDYRNICSWFSKKDFEIIYK